MEMGPIFIGGLANSGKTELRLMLEVHPNLCLTRRTYMWTQIYQRYGNLGVHANFERCLAQMLENKHIQALEPDVERIRKEFWQGEPTYGRLFGLLHSHHAERMGKARWGDQLGSVEQYADAIFATYPTAKMIQMIRNPRHIYEEVKARSHQRAGKVGWILADWLKSVHIARRNQSLYPSNYMIVRYECLMAHPQETLRGICRFIGEEYVPAIMAAPRTRNADGKSHTKGPIAARTRRRLLDPAKRKNVEMSVREIAFMQAYAKEDLVSLGYPLEPLKLSMRDRLIFMLMDWPTNRAAMVAWQTRN